MWPRLVPVYSFGKFAERWQPDRAGTRIPSVPVRLIRVLVCQAATSSDVPGLKTLLLRSSVVQGLLTSAQQLPPSVARICVHLAGLSPTALPSEVCAPAPFICLLHQLPGCLQGDTTPLEELLWSISADEDAHSGECAQLLVNHLPRGFRLVSEGFTLVRLPSVASSSPTSSRSASPRRLPTCTST